MVTLVTPKEVEDFLQRLVEMCRHGGDIDVRDEFPEGMTIRSVRTYEDLLIVNADTGISITMDDRTEYRCTIQRVYR